LGALESVFDLTIDGNAALTSISALSSLTTVLNTLAVTKNPQLINLTGLDGVTRIEGDLDIEIDILLTDLSGLDSLTYVGGTLTITGNDGLLSLAGLESLDTIEGDLLIAFNTAVTSMAALKGVSVLGSCTIVGNDACVGVDCSCEDIVA
jgi:hypothetical protein